MDWAGALSSPRCAEALSAARERSRTTSACAPERRPRAPARGRLVHRSRPAPHVVPRRRAPRVYVEGAAFVGRPLHEMLGLGYVTAMDAHHRARAGERRGVRAPLARPPLQRATPIPGRAATGASGARAVVLDVTDRRRAEEKLRHAVLHDPVTGLPNRTLFLDRVRQAMARARRNSEHAFGLLVLDLDRFKGVNDGLGHLAGDDCLAAVAATRGSLRAAAGHAGPPRRRPVRGARGGSRRDERPRARGRPLPRRPHAAGDHPRAGGLHLRHHRHRAGRPRLHAGGGAAARRPRRHAPRQAPGARRVPGLRRRHARAGPGPPAPGDRAPPRHRARASSASTTSPSSPSTPAAWPRSRGSCAGSIPTAGCWRRTTSCPWPKRRA